MQPAFGCRLAAIRAARDLTQEQLSTTIGKSRQTICHWESGRAPDIRVADLQKIAEILGCRVRDLLAPPETPIPPFHPYTKRRRLATSQSTSEQRRPSLRPVAVRLTS
jgi:transcriptional regulator with XRE-family HTH domain